MQRVRDALRGSLGRTLSSLSDEDRLAAAWPVACGPALAARAQVLGLDADGVLHMRVLQPEWREQFLQMRTMLTDDLRRIADVQLQTIHFEGQGTKNVRRDGGSATSHEARRVRTTQRRKGVETDQ